MIQPKRVGNLEYELKQSLGAALGGCSSDCISDAQRAQAADVLRKVEPEDWRAVVEKKLTIQIPTDDSGSASGTTQVEETWKNQKTFNFFDWTKPDKASGIIDVGGNAQTPGGVLGAPMCIAGVGFHMSGEQECLMVPGVAVSKTDLAAGTVSGLSPDAFTVADVVAFAADNGALGAKTDKALLDYGVCSWQFCEDLIKAENFVWRISGMRSLLDVPADEMASCGPPRGRRGLGRNDVPTAPYVARMQAIYDSLNGFTDRRFIAQNAVRTGFDPVGLISTYVPSTAGQSASVSFGDERSGSRLYTNDCQRWFANHMLLREGLPLQFFLEQNDSEEFLNRALEDLGSTYNGQMVNTDASGAYKFINVASASFNEWNSRAAAPAVAHQQTPTGITVFKYGFVQMTVCLYGMLLIDEQLASMVSSVMMRPATAGGDVWTGFFGGQHLGGICDISPAEGKPLPGEKV